MPSRPLFVTFFVLIVLGPLLILGIASSPAHAQGALAPHAPLLTPGIHCGFLADCTRFDQLGLHVSTAVAVQSDSPAARWDARGAARLALSALDLAEAGVAFSGRISQAPEYGFTARLLPVSLYARLRLLPLPLPGLSQVPFRLGLTYQHELVSATFGGAELTSASQGTLRLLAGQHFSRLDVDGGLGVSLMRADGQRPRAVALELSALASLWLWRGPDAAPNDELRLTAEALVRFPIERAAAAASEQQVLLGFFGQSPRGYGGGLSPRHPGLLRPARASGPGPPASQLGQAVYKPVGRAQSRRAHDHAGLHLGPAGRHRPGAWP